MAFILNLFKVRTWSKTFKNYDLKKFEFELSSLKFKLNRLHRGTSVLQKYCSFKMTQEKVLNFLECSKLSFIMAFIITWQEASSDEKAAY